MKPLDTAETQLRAVLLDNAELVAVVPKQRVSIDAVAVEQPRPYIVFSTQTSEPTFGLGNQLLADDVTIDIQCIGTTRMNAILVRELVKAALVAAGVPWAAVNAGYDPENNIEAEVVTVHWLM